ncbi:MAG: NUDIX domain-containing protein [Candidatus Nomurabacteria bacterium]|jgi:8-oxo-dGTP pyrophosphatase MutT (NUDIX family)|nr:NUDIX domain-containing protein [Candidatus Nomurabacteria bacterium]
MPYQGSYIEKIRQKVGHQLLILPSADVIAVDANGKILLVFNRDTQSWVFPGGYAEENSASAETAARELWEEAGLRADPADLTPIAFISGHTNCYAGGDLTQPYTQVFWADKFTDFGKFQDDSEIARRRWFTTDEISQLDLGRHQRAELAAYRKYLSDHQYQMIDFTGEHFEI